MVMIGMNQHIYHSWWPQMVTHVFSLTSSTQDTYGYDWYQSTYISFLVATDGNYTFLV